MVANKTLLWAVRSSAACFSRLCLHYFSSPPFSAFYTDCGVDIGKPAPKHKGFSEMKLKGMMPMESQTVGQISVQGPEPQPSTVQRIPRRSQRGWIAALAVFLVFAALL